MSDDLAARVEAHERNLNNGFPMTCEIGRDLQEAAARIAALEKAESAIDAMNFTTQIAHHLDDGDQSPADLLRQILNAQNAAIADYRNARKATT